MQIKAAATSGLCNGFNDPNLAERPVKQMIPETPPDFDAKRVLERPDGFYWQELASGSLFGPFPTLLEAVKDMEYSAEAQPEVGETLQEAEEEIGIADWIDPETGEPAEEQVPHIDER